MNQPDITRDQEIDVLLRDVVEFEDDRQRPNDLIDSAFDCKFQTVPGLCPPIYTRLNSRGEIECISSNHWLRCYKRNIPPTALVRVNHLGRISIPFAIEVMKRREEDRTGVSPTTNDETHDEY